MNETLLTGKPYTPAVATDLRETFRRVREQMEKEASKEADEAIRKASHEGRSG